MMKVAQNSGWHSWGWTQTYSTCAARQPLSQPLSLTAQMQSTYLHINKRATYLVPSALCQPRRPSGKRTCGLTWLGRIHCISYHFHGFQKPREAGRAGSGTGSRWGFCLTAYLSTLGQVGA